MKRMFIGPSAFAMLTIIAPSANADPVSECWIGNGKPEAELCLVAVEKNANEALAQIFGQAMQAAKKFDDLTAPRREVVAALSAAQEAWTQYRDKHCEYVGTTWGGGSGNGMAINNCRIEQARKRFDELTEFVQTQTAQ